MIILEQAPEITEAGAGIQIVGRLEEVPTCLTLIYRQAPNAARVLRRLDLLKDLLKYAAQPAMTLMRRYADDQELGPRSHISSALSKKYSAPMLVVHRGDLQHVLHEAANNQAVDIQTKARVVNIDPNFEARVQLSSGEWVEGDLLIGADGIHSRKRAQVASHLGVNDQISPAGHSAYRITMPRDRLAQEPEILRHLDLGISTR